MNKDSEAASKPTWVFDAAQGYARYYLREMCRLSYMLPLLYVKLLRKQYQRTVLGKLWLIIRPAMVMAPYFVIFGILLQVPTGDTPYLLVIITGFSAWMVFARAWYWGTRCIDVVKPMISKARFPLVFMPLTGQGVAVVDFAVYLVYLIGALAWFTIGPGDYRFAFTWGSLTAIYCLLVILVLSAGLSLFTAIGDVIGRDMRFTLRYILQVWLLLTPVVYPLSAVPENLRVYAVWNPMTPLVTTYRTALLEPAAIDYASLVYPTAVAFAVLLLGLLVFCRLDSRLIMNDWR